ncbi:conserved exported hypothetical protein [Burkholderiales bacterium 8X]|nr:conserved exported hypothetical protein [Burkholderiales bacterium 8X]
MNRPLAIKIFNPDSDVRIDRAARRCAAVLAIAALAAGAAVAQPSGNPKGTSAPPTSEVGKAPEGASRRGDSAAARSTTERQTNPGSPQASSGGLRTPGSGTAGGLTGRQPGNSEGPSGARPTNQPAAVDKAKN